MEKPTSECKSVRSERSEFLSLEVQSALAAARCPPPLRRILSSIITALTHNSPRRCWRHLLTLGSSKAAQDSNIVGILFPFCSTFLAAISRGVLCATKRYWLSDWGAGHSGPDLHVLVLLLVLLLLGSEISYGYFEVRESVDCVSSLVTTARLAVLSNAGVQTDLSS